MKTPVFVMFPDRTVRFTSHELTTGHVEQSLFLDPQCHKQWDDTPLTVLWDVEVFVADGAFGKRWTGIATRSFLFDTPETGVASEMGAWGWWPPLQVQLAQQAAAKQRELGANAMVIAADQKAADAKLLRIVR